MRMGVHRHPPAASPSALRPGVGALPAFSPHIRYRSLLHLVHEHEDKQKLIGVFPDSSRVATSCGDGFSATFHQEFDTDPIIREASAHRVSFLLIREYRAD